MFTTCNKDLVKVDGSNRLAEGCPNNSYRPVVAKLSQDKAVTILLHHDCIILVVTTL